MIDKPLIKAFHDLHLSLTPHALFTKLADLKSRPLDLFGLEGRDILAAKVVNNNPAIDNGLLLCHYRGPWRCYLLLVYFNRVV